ncbi:MAG: glycosyltransferase family 4 protein [Verrucomicrobiota bacterium]
MRITIVLYDFIPLGERQEYCMLVAKELSERGHAVHIFTRTWKGRYPNGYRVHILGRLGRTVASQHLHFLESFEDALKDFPVDHIIAFDPVDRCEVYFARDLEKEPLSRAERKTEKALLKAKDRPAIFCEDKGRYDTLAKKLKAQSPQLFLIPPDIARVTRTKADAARIREELRSELNVPAGRHIALYVCSKLEDARGLERCLQALEVNRSAHDIELWVLGGGDPGKYVSETTQNSLKVRFLGGRSDRESFYDAADILLHPYSDPLADKYVLQAIPYGIPILTSKELAHLDQVEVCGGASIIDTIDPSDPAFDHALSELIRDRELYERLSLNALRFAAKEMCYDAHENVASQILEILTNQSDSN